MRGWLRRLAWIWLAAGAIVFLHGAVTGDGLAGAMLYAQLAARHTASPRTVSELLFFPLCLVPLAILLFSYRRNAPPRPRMAPPPKSLVPSLLAGGLLGGSLLLLVRPGAGGWMRNVALALGAISLCAFAAAAWMYLQQPSGSNTYVANINLDTKQQLPPVHRATIRGTLQPQYLLAYAQEEEVRGTGYGRSHNLIPLTAADWQPHDPVHVLADVAGIPPNRAGPFQMQGHIEAAPPGYVRRALRDKGLRLGGDLIVLQSGDESLGEAAMALMIGAIALALCFAFAFAANVTKPAS